jgi:hypothetical protein
MRLCTYRVLQRYAWEGSSVTLHVSILLFRSLCVAHRVTTTRTWPVRSGTLNTHAHSFHLSPSLSPSLSLCRFSGWRLTLRQHALSHRFPSVPAEEVCVSDIEELSANVKHMDLFNYAAAQYSSSSLILRRSRYDWNIEKLHTALTSADKATVCGQPTL